jgi:23S rRNA (uracil1939-C5)-methyltransferase
VVLTLVAERFVAGGDALARDNEGRVVFIDGAIPGETVEVELVDERRDFARARVTRVIDPSSHRVEPPCPAVARGCGGCTWQHVHVDGQRSGRLAIVRDALTRLARLPEADVTLAAVAPGLRTTVRAAADSEGRLGLRARSSHDIVLHEGCLVDHPLVDEILAAARFPGAIDVVVRVGVASGERLVWWQLPKGHRGRLRPTGLADDVATGPEARVHETVAGVQFQVGARSFFQPSPEAAEALVGAVAQAAGDIETDDVLVDAYGGIGLFAATVGRAARKVVVVEESRWACDDAAVNLRDRPHRVVSGRVEHLASAHPGEVSSLVDDVSEDRCLVIADPARSGLGRNGVEGLARFGARRIVLVSCDAAAFGRDTALLAEAGYRHAGSTVLDQFAHTHHVEIVTRFDRVTGPPES